MLCHTMYIFYVHMLKKKDLMKKNSKSSTKPRSDELRDLDEKWGECFARLEAMLLSKTFAVACPLV